MLRRDVNPHLRAERCPRCTMQPGPVHAPDCPLHAAAGRVVRQLELAGAITPGLGGRRVHDALTWLLCEVLK